MSSKNRKSQKSEMPLSVADIYNTVSPKTGNDLVGTKRYLEAIAKIAKNPTLLKKLVGH